MKHNYSDAITNKTVLIFGPYPLPLGGVSVHVERVAKKLMQQDNAVTVFDTTDQDKYRSFTRYLWNVRRCIAQTQPHSVYFHTLYLRKSLYDLALLVNLKKKYGYRLCLIEHDCRHMYQRSWLFKKMLNRLMRAVDELVVIGNRTHQSYTDAHIVLPAHTVMEAAFIPPDQTAYARLMEQYPQYLFDFIERHTPLLGMNAFQCVPMNGKDLYGLRMSIELLSSLKELYPAIGLVIVLSQIGDAAYLKQVQALIDCYGIRDHIFILGADHHLWPLLQQFDLFIRPTLSDGESVSVQEALYFKVPVVASDVCARPEGVTVFTTGSQDDFNKKVVEVLYERFNKQRHYLYQKQIG